MSALGIHDLALFVVAGLLLNLTPGPDMLLIIGRATAQGFRAGAAAALGIAAGCLVHTFAVAIGVAALLATSALAFAAIKWGGAAYLLYLGVQMLRTRGASRQPTEQALVPAAPWVIFRQGVLTNVLNPKVALFFLAFLPQFIGGDSAHQGAATVVLGVIFIVNSLFVILPIAWFAAQARAWLVGTGNAARAQIWLGRALGVLFVGLAIRLATSKAD